MRAYDKKTDFLAESFKGSSLSLSPAAPLVLLDAPFFYFFFFTRSPVFKRQRRAG